MGWLKEAAMTALSLLFTCLLLIAVLVAACAAVSVVSDFAGIELLIILPKEQPQQPPGSDKPPDAGEAL